MTIKKFDMDVMSGLRLHTMNHIVQTKNKRQKAYVTAVVIKDGDPRNSFELGVNQRKTHPFQHKYAKHPEAIYLHAETDAIRRYIKHTGSSNFYNTTLYVCRLKYIDNKKSSIITGLAKPCAGCMRCIVTFGISRIIYTTDDQHYLEELF